MRNPNGYGSVVKLGGNRRRPYMVRKTIGWNAKRHPIYLIIGYYVTREEALIALAQYNKDPWDVDKAKTTFADLYKLWTDKKAHKLGTSNQASLFAAYKHCRTLHTMKFTAIRPVHMQECIDKCGRGPSTQAAIKNLIRHLERFALEMDMITRTYCELLESESAQESNKIPFSEEELVRVWENAETPWVDSVLFFLYTGFRISEMLDIRITNINLDEGTIQGGTKTESGKNRFVPIHNSILPIVRKRLESADKSDYLFSENGRALTKASYYKYWNMAMGQLNMDHTPHECRHTFISRLDTAGANRKCIDLLAGHKSKEVGLRVYTHKTMDELRATICLLS
jgi:integrase